MFLIRVPSKKHLAQSACSNPHVSHDFVRATVIFALCWCLYNNLIIYNMI